TRIGGDDVVEMTRQSDGRLSRPRSRIPGVRLRRRDLRQELKQRVRIARPERGVSRGNAGEMIRERHGLGAAGGGGGGAGTSEGVPGKPNLMLRVRSAGTRAR